MSTPIHFTLDQLCVFDAIIHHGSFALAAKKLHRVPSAVSYSIKTLEESLGVDLFDRTKRKAVLTPEGTRFHIEAQRLLQSAERLQMLATDWSQGWEEQLRIVIDGVIPMEPVSKALQRITQLNPPTQILVDIEFQEGVPERFFQERADMMVILDYQNEGEELEEHPLPDLEMILVVAPQQRKGKTGEELLSQGMNLIVRDSASIYRTKPKQAFQPGKNNMFVSDFHSKRLAILSGIGVGWMPTHLIQDDLRNGSLTLIEDIEPNRWIYKPKLTRLLAKPLGKAGRMFQMALREELNIFSSL